MVAATSAVIVPEISIDNGLAKGRYGYDSDSTPEPSIIVNIFNNEECRKGAAARNNN